jgi:hypothetical protein
MNNASATQTSWMLQDQQQKMDDASKAQQDNLQQQIDAINAAKDAYVQAQQDKKAALDDQKQAELDALDRSSAGAGRRFAEAEAGRAGRFAGQGGRDQQGYAE